MGILTALQYLREYLSAWKEAAAWAASRHPRDPKTGRFVSSGSAGAVFFDAKGNRRDHATKKILRQERISTRQERRNARQSQKTINEQEGSLKGSDLFHDKRMARAFDKSREEFETKSARELVEIFRSEFKAASWLVGHWQGSPSSALASELKTLAKKWENLPGRIRTVAEWSESERRKAVETEFNASKVSITDQAKIQKGHSWARLRAIGQALLDKQYPGQSEIQLYRGIDGTTGRLINESLSKTKGKIELEEDCLTGYSSRIEIAHKFGAKYKGITIGRKVAKKDIVIPSAITETGYPQFNEAEFIIRNTQRKLTLSRKDIITKWKA